MSRFVKHHRAPVIYFAGPHDGWRATVANVGRSKERYNANDYEAPDDSRFKYAGPENADTSCFEPNCMMGIRETDFVFGYLKNPMDYATIAELAYACAIGVDVYLAVGPGVSEEMLPALAFLAIDNVTRVDDDTEAKVVFDQILIEVVKSGGRKLFSLEDHEGYSHELKQKSAVRSKSKHICCECGSDNVMLEQIVAFWNLDTQQWETSYDDAEAYCVNCDSGDVQLIEVVIAETAL